MRTRIISASPLCAVLITSTRSRLNMKQNFRAMNLWSVASAHLFAGTQPLWCIAHSAQASVLVDIFRHTHLLLHSTKLASTTSSAERIIPAAEIRFISRVTQVQECMHAHLSKVALPKSRWMDSDKNSPMMAADSLLIRTLV
ncbi:unannotated protein [freshwater metagenome]|uniref:Unannotated protein n=1 Tax=freshwater metagenome TaxID=449393 RepID=A0A6J6S405_9ZZZZ